jgi:ribonuclease P protein component
LRQQKQFATMRAAGRRFAGATCVLVVLKTPPDGMRKAAFLISRRYSHRAVVRNRARRLFREVYRQMYEQLPPSWLLFIPRQRLQDAGLADVLRDVYEQARKASLLMAAPPPTNHDSEPSTTLDA